MSDQFITALSAQYANKVAIGLLSVSDAIALAIEEDRRRAPARNLVGMTARQREALKFIRSYIEQHEVSPSFDEIMAALGLVSKSGVKKLVDALVERGFIRTLPYRARSIALT